jgi:hypothetical protein
MTFTSYTSLQATSFTELFFIKVNAANGEINQQPIAIQGISAAQQAYLQKNASGEIVMAGTFNKDLTINGNQLTANGKTDIFYATYDESINNFKNEVSFGGSDEDLLNDFLISPADEFYFVGSFKTDFSSGLSTFEATTSKKSDGFFIKIDNTGATTIAKKIGGDHNDQLKKLAVDADGNIYIAGEYEYNIVIDGTPFNTTKKHDSFLLQLNASGNHGWETQLGTNAYNTISSIEIAGDMIYLTGAFRGTLEDEISTRNSKDAYLALYQKETGAQNWLEKAGHNHEDNLNIKRYPDGKILVSGFFCNAFELKDKDNFEVFAINDKNYKDLYIAKLVDCSTMPAPELGEDQTACGSYKITAPDGYLSYSWNSGVFSDVNTFTATETGIVQLTVIDNSNCELTDEVNITISEGVTIDLGGPVATICEGDDLVLDAGSGYDNYLWEDESTSQTRTVNTAGTYTVQASNASGCGTGSIVVTVTPSPIVSLGPDVTAPADTTIYLHTNLSVDEYSFSWLDRSTQPYLCVPMYKVEQLGGAVELWVDVTSLSTSCTTRASVWVYVASQPAALMTENTDNSHKNITTENETTTTELQDIENNNPEYKVYPNPSSGKFYLSVSNPDKVNLVKVFDLKGNIVKTYQNEFSFPLEIDLTGQAKGVYFVKVNNELDTRELKVIIK